MNESLILADAAGGDAASNCAGENGKVVFLVRHAESLQNVAMRRLVRCDCRVLPSVCCLGQDPALSSAGLSQLESARDGARLLLARRGVELVAHSPLQRARETAVQLFGSDDVPMVGLPSAYELTVQEVLCCGAGVRTRIQSVERWLAARPERTIVLVGHEVFSKLALGRRGGIPNVGCVECRCDPETGTLRMLRDIHFEALAADPDMMERGDVPNSLGAYASDDEAKPLR
jgi:broad specificity phosphatase PhoE